MRSLFERALTGHVLREQIAPGVDMIHGQKWGQLMGSPASFPVLCIANLAMSVVALRSVERESTVEPRPIGRSGILVNGDDIAFRATRQAIEAWQELTSAYGLAPSVGKNYRSRDFVQLNSKMFVMRSVMSESLASELYALGLVPTLRYSFEKVTASSIAVLSPPREVKFAEWCLSAPEWQSTFLDRSEGPERERLESLWLEVWSAYLARLPSGLMNWFFPRSLGGFGLKTSKEVVANEAQRRIAAWYRDNTDAQAARDARLRWHSDPPRTTTHLDALGVVAALESLGAVEYGDLTSADSELDLSSLEQSLILSGFSGFVTLSGVDRVPDAIRRLIADDELWAAVPEAAAQVSSWSRLVPRPVLRSVLEVDGRRGAFFHLGKNLYSRGRGPGREIIKITPISDMLINISYYRLGKVDLLGPEGGDWLRRMTRRLRSAASSTARSMSEDEVRRYRAPSRGYRFVFTPTHGRSAPVIADVRTGRVKVRSVLPTVVDSGAPCSVRPLGPFLAWAVDLSASGKARTTGISLGSEKLLRDLGDLAA